MFENSHSLSSGELNEKNGEKDQYKKGNIVFFTEGTETFNQLELTKKNY